MRVVRRHVSDQERATEYFVRVCGALSDDGFRRLRSFRPDGPARFRTWLMAVAANLCIDWCRREQGRVCSLERAVAKGGAAYCWGHNRYGQLGTRNTSDSSVPVLVAGGLTFKSVTAHQMVTCGITVDGDGNFPAPDTTSPVPVVGDLVFDAIDSDWVSCGVAGGAAYCWGPGTEGSIGDGARVNRGVPTKAAGQ